MKKLINKCRTYMAGGGCGFVKKAASKLLHVNLIKYNRYYLTHKPSKQKLISQREKICEGAPLISVVVPAFRTKPVFMRRLIASVMNSSYENWELIIADGSGYELTQEEYPELERIVGQASCGDKRVIYKRLEENLGIAGNTNEAIALARGEWVVFCDHDDELSADALYGIYHVAKKKPAVDLIYSDEDKIDERGLHYDPHFKPEFDMELLRNVNYISHMTAVKRSLLESVGVLNSEYDGAQDYDFILRAVEKATCIHHISHVLYHWRCHRGSTASDMSTKTYAIDAGRRALQAHLDRTRDGGIARDGAIAGTYRVTYELEKLPDIAIVKTSKNTIPVVDISAYRDKLILFVDKSVEITDELLGVLAGNCMRQGVGAVGTLIGDGAKIVQGGFVYGVGDTFTGVPLGEPGYMGRLLMSRSVSALSSKCMMIRGELFYRAGGIDMSMENSWDRDLCAKCANMREKVIILPEIVSVNGAVRNPVSEAFNKRYAQAQDRWYNRAFSKKSPGFELE